MAKHENLTSAETAVAECIDWAFRDGYAFAEQAGEAFAKIAGLRMGKESLGLYGDRLTFKRNSTR